MRMIAFIMLAASLIACGPEPETPPDPVVPEVDTPELIQPDTLADAIIDSASIEAPEDGQKPMSVLEQRCIDAGLARIRDYDSTIVIELRYSTENNFLGIDMYADFEEGYLQPEVAEKLARAQAALHKKDSTLNIIVFDAVRPRSVQQRMWDTLQMPIEEKVKFVSNPRNGSLHNYGAAVDVSLVDVDGNILDMGAPYDHIGELAWPVKEEELLAQGLITQEAIDNRKLLRSVMRRGGFWNIQTEWWHFNSCRRDTAAKYYTILE